jgi:hypothetical protein
VGVSYSQVPVRPDYGCEPFDLNEIGQSRLTDTLSVKLSVRAMGSRSDGRDEKKGRYSPRLGFWREIPARAARCWTLASFRWFLAMEKRWMVCRATRQTRMCERRDQLLPRAAAVGGRRGSWAPASSGEQWCGGLLQNRTSRGREEVR